MTNDTALLQEELENLRLDRDFMLEYLRKYTISQYAKMGMHINKGWYKSNTTATNDRGRKTILSADEVLRTIDMRLFLQAMFWFIVNKYKSQTIEATEKIGDDAFWLDFLRLAKTADWNPERVHQGILNSASPHLPRPVKIASWLYLWLWCDFPANRGTSLPEEAFQSLSHIYFSREQKDRWNKLPDFGVEPLFKNQVYRTNLAIDMSTSPISDWFTFALSKHRPDHVCHWLEQYPTDQLSMSLQDVMLYAVATYRGDNAVKVIKCLEKLSPGICLNFQDQHGNNLLWYTITCSQLGRLRGYDSQNDSSRRKDTCHCSAVEKIWRHLTDKLGDRKGRNASCIKTLQCLFALGLSPDQPNNYGFTYHDIDDYGQMLGERWETTRLRHNTATLDDDRYWRHSAKRRATTK